MAESHSLRVFGGIGTVALVYGPLKYLETKSAIFFILAFVSLSYLIGFLIDRSDDNG